MKRKIWKRAGSILLAMTLTIGCLAGCGKGSGDGNRGGNGGGGGGSAANASLAKEHVYRYQELELPEFGGDDLGVQALVKTDDKLRLLVTVYNWNQNSQTDFRLVSMNFDGSDISLMCRTQGRRVCRIRQIFRRMSPRRMEPIFLRPEREPAPKLLKMRETGKMRRPERTLRKTPGRSRI